MHENNIVSVTIVRKNAASLTQHQQQEEEEYDPSSAGVVASTRNPNNTNNKTDNRSNPRSVGRNNAPRSCSRQLVRQKSILTKNHRTNNFWVILGDRWSTKIRPRICRFFLEHDKGCGVRSAIIASRVVFILGVKNIFESRILCVLVRTSRTRSCLRYYLWIPAQAFIHS